jgi:hypothetical protein
MVAMDETASPEKAVERLKTLLPLPEAFERILLEYGRNQGRVWELGWLDDPVIRKLVETHLSSNIDEITVTPSYLVFVRTLPEEGERELYVFGLSENGKLFLNMFGDEGEDIVEKDRVCRLGDTNVYVSMSDHEVRCMFDFRSFAPHGAMLSVEEVNDTVGFRLQGDVVAYICRFTDPEDLNLQRLLREEFENELGRYLRLYVLDIIYAALLEQGFSIRVEKDHSRPDLDMIVEGITAPDFEQNKHAFTSILGKYLHVLNTDSKPGRLVMELESHDFGVFSADFLVYQTREGERLGIMVYPIEIDGFPAAMRIVREFEESLPAALRSVPETISFRLGNHRVTLRNFISSTMTFSPSLRPTFFDQPVEIRLTDGRSRFISLPNASITLEHREHGTKTVYVAPYLALALDMTRVSEKFTAYRNRAVLKVLGEQAKEALS